MVNGVGLVEFVDAVFIMQTSSWVTHPVRSTRMVSQIPRMAVDIVANQAS
jgi:hypothetical protein